MRALFSLMLIAATAASAAAGNTELTIGSFDRALRSASADAVTEDTLGGGALGVGRRLDLGLVPNLETWVTAGTSWGASSGVMFQTMETEVDTVGLALGARARYALHSHVALSGRLELGTERDALTLRGNGHTVSDAAWGGTATVASGVDLLMLASPRFTLGVRFELGYITASASSLSPHEEGDGSKIEIQGMSESIGHLDLGGKFFAFSLLSQF